MGVMSLCLPDEVLERLDRLAKAMGRTKTYYVTEAINRHLNDLENLCLAETRSRDLQKGRSETIPLKEITDQYNSED